jgi:hypothetical protein
MSPAGRHCGDCQACCTLLPVKSIPGKTAGVRCQHQRHRKGCTIYPDRPFECRIWSCLWLTDPDGTAGMGRPDRTHYVVDPVPDFIAVQPAGEDHKTEIPVIQVWCDPAWPDAFEDPRLLAYLARRAEKEGCAVLVRYDSSRAITLFPPALNENGEWSRLTAKDADIKVMPDTPGRRMHAFMLAQKEASDTPSHTVTPLV